MPFTPLVVLGLFIPGSYGRLPPPECQDTYPTLQGRFTYDANELVFGNAENFSAVSATALSGSLEVGNRYKETFPDDDPVGPLFELEADEALGGDLICAFPPDEKLFFQCTEKDLKYLFRFDISQFKPGSCDVLRLEFAGYRATPDAPANANVTENFPLPIFTFPKVRSILAGTAEPEQSSTNSYYGYYGVRKRPWLRWWRKQRPGRLLSQRSLQPSFPKLNGLTFNFTAVLNDIDQPFYPCRGTYEFIQYDATGEISDSGQFLAMTVRVFTFSSGIALQTQFMSCVFLSSTSPTSLLCNNQLLNLVGRADVDVDVEGKAIGIQLFGDYRFSQQTAFGPAIGPTLDFPLQKCNGGFPTLGNLVCNLTAVRVIDGGLRGFATQEFFALQFQGDAVGNFSASGRVASLTTYTNETALCAWRDGMTLSCIFEATCLVIEGNVLVDADCNAVAINAVGSSGGWCSGALVPDASGQLGFRFYDDPPAAFQWLGSCEREVSMSQFEAYNCNCAVDTPLGNERLCGFAFMATENYRAMGLEDCQQRNLKSTASECEVFIQTLEGTLFDFTFDQGATIPVIPTSQTCLLYKDQLSLSQVSR